mgnify:CR=1 FL=1|jgi:hypothetical protein
MNDSKKKGIPRNDEERQGQGEGTYRDAETPASDPSTFDDEFETRQENEISREETSTEKANRPGKD